MTHSPELEPESEAQQAVDDEAGADVDEEDDPAAHLNELEDGAGCTEIWSHLSESRDDGE